MATILAQLGINETFFYQIGIFFILFVILGPLYFKPFLKLIEERHKKTVEDRETAQKMLEQAQAKFTEYKDRLNQERLSIKKDLDLALGEAKKEEASIMASARDEAKKITQGAIEQIETQKIELQKKLDADVEAISLQITQKILGGKS